MSEENRLKQTFRMFLKKAVDSFEPNRNLLDNPWFTVNQRDFETTTAYGYTVDRWRNNSASGNHRITLSANHVITCEAVNGNGYLRQDFENALPPGLYTFSVNALEISGAVSFGYSDASGMPHTIQIREVGISNASFDCNGIQYVFLQIATGGRIRFDSIKLESGDVSTLANDSAPDYAAELLKCQRYYVRFHDIVLARAQYIAANSIYFDFPIPAVMSGIASPVITNSAGLSVRSLTYATQAGFSFTVQNRRGSNFIRITATKTAHGLADAVLRIEDVGISVEP